MSRDGGGGRRRVGAGIHLPLFAGSIEFSDYALMSALAPVFADFNMAFSCDQLSERKLRFFDEVSRYLFRSRALILL